MNNLRLIRTNAKMTQKQLAARLSISPTAISKYELEQLGMDAKIICAICDIFGCTADHLLGRAAPTPPDLLADDAQLLSAYHAADQNIRDAVDLLLRPAKAEKKKAG